MSGKRLILMRHAKSSWTTHGEKDHERALNPRGVRDAPRMAEALVHRKWVPDLALVSSAVRTTETWQRMEVEFARPISVVYDASLYLADTAAMRRALLAVSDDVQTVLLLAHNPGCAAATAWFSGEQTEVTTANAMLLIGESNSWADLVGGPTRFELFEHLRPKEL